MDSDINKHIIKKISYHEQLRDEMEQIEEYEKCAYHRDEVTRLQNMLEAVTI